MDIKLVPAYLDRKLFLKLAKDYVKELSQYDDMIRWDEPSWIGIMWMADLIITGGITCGFAIKEVVQFDGCPDALYISEFYIIPEVRRNGTGTAAVSALTKDWDGDVFLYILADNFAAKAFWNAVKKNNEWEEISRSEIKKEPGCFLKVYRTK